jgi:hypothetical protein
MDDLKEDTVWKTLDAMDNQDGEKKHSYTDDDGTHKDAIDLLKQWGIKEAAEFDKNPGPVTDDSKPWLQ